MDSIYHTQRLAIAVPDPSLYRTKSSGFGRTEQWGPTIYKVGKTCQHIHNPAYYYYMYSTCMYAGPYRWESLAFYFVFVDRTYILLRIPWMRGNLIYACRIGIGTYWVV